jgi:hypothetical protein
MIKALRAILLSAALVGFLTGWSLAQTAKPEHPSATEPAKAEQSKTETAKPEQPKVEEKKPDTTKTEQKKSEASKPEEKKPEHPK